METKDLISIQQFCTHYNIPISFIDLLNEFELIEIVVIKEIHCIHKAQIKDIEKMIRLHYNLDINIEGIDAIYNLLKQIETLREESNELINKLRLYEDI